MLVNDSNIIVKVSWELLLAEAKVIADKEPFIEELIKKSILQYNSFSEVLAEILSLHFEGSISQNNWRRLFLEVLNEFPCQSEINYGETDIRSLQSLVDIALYDLAIVKDRDPATTHLIHPVLYYKGYKAVQSYRISHRLWMTGRKDIALLIQSRGSEIFGVDIHPAAVIGPGFLLDHGTGVVIGETAVVGAHCSFLHGVTLGSTGKERGDRHPKIGDSVLIGCGATILGNIIVESCCKIGSGSMVLKPLPRGATAVGNPARIVGYTNCECPAGSMDVGLIDVILPGGEKFNDTWSISVDGSTVFKEVDKDCQGKLCPIGTSQALTLRFGAKPPSRIINELFSYADCDKDGLINENEFETLAMKYMETCSMTSLANQVITASADWASSLFSTAFKK
jgi:serine O-acetyltransferase